MKTIFIPLQTKIKEQAELAADMAAHKHGFKKGSKEWEKAFQHSLEERYIHSSHAGIDVDSNPHSPMLPDDVFKQFDTFMSSGALNSSTKYGNYEDNFRSFKGAISILTTLYCYSVLGLTIEDFNLQKNASKESVVKTAANIYARYLVSVAMLAALEPVFNIKASEMNQVLLSMEIDKKPIEALRDKEQRKAFLASVTNYMRNFFGKASVFKQNEG